MLAPTNDHSASPVSTGVKHMTSEAKAATKEDGPALPVTTVEELDHPAAPVTTVEELDRPASPVTTVEELDHPASPVTTVEELDHPASPVTTVEELDHPASPVTTVEELDHPASPVTTVEESNSPAAPVELASVKLPTIMRKRGRPKESGQTLIGLPKKKRLADVMPTPFAERSKADKEKGLFHILQIHHIFSQC